MKILQIIEAGGWTFEGPDALDPAAFRHDRLLAIGLVANDAGDHEVMGITPDGELIPADFTHEALLDCPCLTEPFSGHKRGRR